MKRGPVRTLASSLRLCRVLDAIRDAYPGAIEVRALARSFHIDERKARHDIETLQLGYAIETDDGEPFDRGGRGPRRIVWASNPKAMVERKAAG